MSVAEVCPICERASLIQTGPRQWDCQRSRCNSTLYVDPADGTINVRDREEHKPRRNGDRMPDRRRGCRFFAIYIVLLIAAIAYVWLR